MLIHPWLVVAALSLEAAAGYPRWLYRLVRHPVVWIGGLIGLLERRFNRPAWPFAARCALGVLALIVICAVAGFCGWAIEAAPLPAPAVSLLVIVVATSGLAQRSLYEHVAVVAKALRSGDLDAARAKVGRIVGRDVGALDADQIAAAAIESLAESFSDSVVAPVFWLLIGGLPGLLIYKAVNTADSMIGHLETRWRAFGWASARFDDLLNLIPARLAGLLIAAAARRGVRTMLRDAGKHASPNAGWPEAAMAGALGRILGGPAIYEGVVLRRPALGGGPPPSAADLDRALRLYIIACGLLWALLIAGGLAWPR
jgi:adenosylcobinamide-phosphate synthase